MARADKTTVIIPRAGASSSLAILVALAALVAATLAAYWPVLRHQFLIEWDDPDYVTRNFHVQQGLTAQSIAWAFRSTEYANWFPVTWLSHMLDFQLYGLRPLGHHLTSLVLHIVNSLLLFAVLWRMTQTAWRSFAVAGLFALHPLHVESVAWVAERKDVLSTFFFLLTIWAYTRYAERSGFRVQAPTIQSSKFKVQGSRFGPPQFYALTLLLFALGLMSKPMLVTLPVLLLLLDFWPLKRMEKGERRREHGGKKPGSPAPNSASVLPLLTEKLPFLALSAASCLMTLLVQRKGGAVASVETVSLAARLANMPVAYIRYLGKTLFPVGLSPLYPFDFHLPGGLVVGSAALLVAVTVGAWQLRRKFPYLLTGWLWYVVTLLPVIGLIQVGGQAMADRYTYVPLIGIFIAMAWAFWDLARQRVASHSVPTGKRKLAATPPRASAPGLAPLRASRGEASGQGDQTRTRWAIGASLAAIFLCLALATRHCVGYWQDSFAVFSRVLSVAEACDTAHFNLGLVLATQQSKFAEAAEHFARAASLNPHHAGARFSLGLCLEKLDDRTQAAHWYREALTVDPANGPAHHNLAICLEVSGQQTEAIAHYEAALKAMPQDALVRTNLANAHANLAASLYTQGRYADAWQAIDSCRRYGGVPPPALLTNLMEQLPQAGRQ